MLQTVRISVSGKVQGVGFRYGVKEKAKQLSLTGEVQNTRHGTVEIIASGEHYAIEDLINWCRTGPPGSNVSSVSVSPMQLTNYNEFSIVRR